jgi:hypothetical protein
MMKGRDGAREDWFEYDLEFGALSRACEAEGIELVSCIWDQPFDTDSFDAFMIGTVWDYPPKQALFLDTLDAAERQSARAQFARHRALEHRKDLSARAG